MTLYQENTGRNEESIRRSGDYLDSKAEKREKRIDKLLMFAIIATAVMLVIVVFMGRL